MPQPEKNTITQTTRDANTGELLTDESKGGQKKPQAKQEPIAEPEETNDATRK